MEATRLAMKKTGSGMQKGPKVKKKGMQKGPKMEKTGLGLALKKPAAREGPAAPAAPTRAASNQDLHSRLLMLLDKPWKDMSPEEQQQVLEQLPGPNRDVYNAFHKAMATDSDIPEYWKEYYEKVLSTKMERGRNTNKINDLQAMCKGWWAMAVTESGTLISACDGGSAWEGGGGIATRAHTKMCPLPLTTRCVMSEATL